MNQILLLIINLNALFYSSILQTICMQTNIFVNYIQYKLSQKKQIEQSYQKWQIKIHEI